MPRKGNISLGVNLFASFCCSRTYTVAYLNIDYGNLSKFCWKCNETWCDSMHI